MSTSDQTVDTVEFERVEVPRAKNSKSETSALIPALTGALVGAAIAIGVTMTLMDQRIMALEAKLDAKIPEFAIVNTMEMALYQAEKFGDDEAKIGEFLRSVSAKVDALKADGVLLFDASTMVSYPEAYAIGPETLAVEGGEK